MSKDSRIPEFQSRFQELKKKNKSHIEELIERFLPVNSIPDTQETAPGEPVILQEMPMPYGPVIIKGTGAGVNGMTAHIDGTVFNIIDFLNQSLEIVHLDSYADILRKYETRIKTTNLIEYDYPDPGYTPAYLNKLIYEYETYPDDAALYKALISEYNTALKDLADYIIQWDTLMEQWYNSIAANPRNGKLEIFR
jgi:hypothetical protein